MNQILNMMLLGFSLSMDAFSLAIFLGTFLNKKKAVLLLILVGLFHLIFPLLGALIGYKIINVFNINGNYIFGIILILISIQIIIDLWKSDRKIPEICWYELVLIAFCVSIDSFSIGIGLSFYQYNIFLASFIFLISSITFTYIGLLIGKYFNKILGFYSKILGAILLFALGVYHLFY